MASTYGVKYAGSRGYVNSPGRTRQSLSSLMGGDTSMQPISSSGFNRPTYINSPGANPAGANAFTNAAAGFQKINAARDPSVPTPPSSAPANTSPAGPAAQAPSGFDETGDPILAQIKAAGKRNILDASSGALAGAKNDLIGYGSTNVPQSLRDLYANQAPSSDALFGDLPGNAVLGALNDQGTAQAASQNPYSTLAQLLGAHNANTAGIDTATNANNLYYSSTHANQLGQEGQDYLGAQNTAAQNLAGLLGGENQGVLGAIGGAHDQYLGALPSAYDRWVQMGGTATGTPVPTAGDGTTATAPTAGDSTTVPTNTPTGPTGGLTGTQVSPYLAALLKSGWTQFQ